MKSFGKGEEEPSPEKSVACPICGNAYVMFDHKHTEFRGVKVRIYSRLCYGYKNSNYERNANGIRKI